MVVAQKGGRVSPTSAVHTHIRWKQATAALVDTTRPAAPRRTLGGEVGGPQSLLQRCNVAHGTVQVLGIRLVAHALMQQPHVSLAPGSGASSAAADTLQALSRVLQAQAPSCQGRWAGWAGWVLLGSAGPGSCLHTPRVPCQGTCMDWNGLCLGRLPGMHWPCSWG